MFDYRFKLILILTVGVQLLCGRSRVNQAYAVCCTFQNVLPFLFIYFFFFFFGGGALQ